MPWRVFPWDPGAKLGEPFSPSYIHPNQGSGRFDDLCDPAVLVKHAIAPDVLASRDFAKTQRVAMALDKEGFSGLRWWSALSGDWHTIVVFEGEIEYGKPEPLTIGHQAVQEASEALGIPRRALSRL